MQKALIVFLIVFLGLIGALLGVFGLLFTPLYAGAIPVPIGIVVSVLTLPGLVRSAGELDPRPFAASAPLAGWLIAVLGIGFTGPGGDTMLPPTWQSLMLVVGGTAVGLWSIRTVLLEEHALEQDVPVRE